MFQHTAARRRLVKLMTMLFKRLMFQHTAARRRLGASSSNPAQTNCFNTQPPEGGWPCPNLLDRLFQGVSTHSRPKAAGAVLILPSLSTWFQHTAARRRLHLAQFHLDRYPCFNTQPPEGGCRRLVRPLIKHQVSTHSRPKAAVSQSFFVFLKKWFQHTAARRRLPVFVFHKFRFFRFQHTAARRRLKVTLLVILPEQMFQHTAARRRLSTIAM